MTNRTPLLVFTVLATCGTVSAQAPATAWPQFRGSAPLIGISAAQMPVSLKVQWTYEAGDAIESSAAIADGTVFVTVASGELVALGLDKGQVKWKYKVELGFGESSPPHIGHERLTHRRDERTRQMKSRHACVSGDIVER